MVFRFCNNISGASNKICIEYVHTYIHTYVMLLSTGCNSDIWKKVQANILREPLVLLKETNPQHKALDFSFILAPWKWAWRYQEGATPSCPTRSQKPFAPTYAFSGEWGWRPPDNATPSNFLFSKSWDQELSADSLLVFVLILVLSEYWKRLEENFLNMFISAISQNDKE